MADAYFFGFGFLLMVRFYFNAGYIVNTVHNFTVDPPIVEFSNSGNPRFSGKFSADHFYSIGVRELEYKIEHSLA